MGCVYTALVTPFQPDGSVDLLAYKRLIENQLEAGIHGLVVCGSTGEGMTLESHEKESLLKVAVRLASGKVPVIMGAGHANTREACVWQKKAEDLGASHTLHVTPWYNKPTPEGLLAHYEAVTTSSALPIILYNVPGRTQCNLPVDVVLQLASSFKNIIGLKECNLDPIRLYALIDQAPRGFQFFSGEDAFILPMLDLGGHGVISVWSNWAPEKFVRLVNQRDQHLAAQIARLSNIAPTRPNPIPIKTVMGLDRFRLPLLALPESEKQDLQAKARRSLESAH